MSRKIRAVLICSYSDSVRRNILKYKSFSVENAVRKLLKRTLISHRDYAPWIPLFITEFEKQNEIELHVIHPVFGLESKIQEYTLSNVFYHAFRCSSTSILNRMKKSSRYYAYNYKLISLIVDSINPDVVCLCGAENLSYSPSVLRIKGKPIFVLLQTLLNSPKLIRFKVGSEERRIYEKSVLESVDYIGTNISYYQFVKQINGQAKYLHIGFPVASPKRIISNVKNVDFVFFSVQLTKNKGIEDALDAFAFVCQKYPDATLNIIGGCTSDYKDFLISKVNSLGIVNNVSFLGYFDKHEDVFKQIAKAKNAILPGITAIFNSTVREAMFMGIPTITYKSCDLSCFDTNGEFLLFAELEDVRQLGERMLYAYEYPEDVQEMAKRACQYAQDNFSAGVYSQNLIDDIRAIYNNYYKNQPIPSELEIRDI